MKKLFILPILITSFGAIAQSKKPVTPVKPEVAIEDTVNRIQSYKDMAIRIQAMDGLQFAVRQPGDITPNQKSNLLRVVDSLNKYDILWYNRIEAIKQKANAKKP